MLSMKLCRISSPSLPCTHIKYCLSRPRAANADTSVGDALGELYHPVLTIGGRLPFAVAGFPRIKRNGRHFLDRGEIFLSLPAHLLRDQGCQGRDLRINTIEPHALDVRISPSSDERRKNWHAAGNNSRCQLIETILSPKRLTSIKIERRTEQLPLDRFLRQARFMRGQRTIARLGK